MYCIYRAPIDYMVQWGPIFRRPVDSQLGAGPTAFDATKALMNARGKQRELSF